MVAELRKLDKSLYETDYNLWVLETASQLRRQDLDALDWENLIEEVEALSRRDKKKLKSLLRLLVEHLLKLIYWENEIENNRGHWEAEIINFRKLIQDELTDSPSLTRYLHEVWQECYQDGREMAAKRSSLPLSVIHETPITTLEQALDKDWFPASPED